MSLFPEPRSPFHDINGVKLSTRLRLDFSHPNEHDIINPMCSCSKEPETTLHDPLRCNLYSISRLELLNNICALKGSLENSSEETLLRILLYGAEDFTSQMNSEIFKMHNKVY